MNVFKNKNDDKNKKNVKNVKTSFTSMLNCMQMLLCVTWITHGNGTGCTK